MTTCNPTVRHPGELPGSTPNPSSRPSAPVRSLSAVAMAAVFYGLLVTLILAYEISMGVTTP